MIAETIEGPGGREAYHFRLDFSETLPTPREIETVLGYTIAEAPEPVGAAIEATLATTAELWSIEGGYVIVPSASVDLGQKRVHVGATSFAVGPIICGQLARAEGLAAFLCTAGPGIEEHSRALLSAGDPLAGYVADTVGSLVVERALDRIEDHLIALLSRRALRTTQRYSPGYCGWSVAEQEQLFSLLPPDFCRVRLTESSLMQPIKSVSGVVGFGRDVRRNPYNCHLCEIDHCLYRRLPQKAPVD